MGCSGRKCNFKLGLEYCRNPQKRTFSIEATGINVVKTMENIFGIKFHWYKKGFTEVPYMVKCITVIPKKTEERLLIEILNSLSTSYAAIGSKEYKEYLTRIQPSINYE